MVVVVHLNDDGGGGGGACRVVGEGGELVQPAGRGRGGCGGGGGGLLQLAHPEGTPAPGDPACGAQIAIPPTHPPPHSNEEGVVEGVAASYSLLTQREPQNQVIMHVVHVSTDPVKVHEPLEPTKGPAWIQTRASEAPLAFENDRV